MILQTDTYHIICKKERLPQKIVTITKDKRLKSWGGEIKVKA